jgi:molybdenum cofactor cytidylyltransferase
MADVNHSPKSKARVAALILAAGGATRMGSTKALLPWGRTTLLGHCVKVALSSSVDEVHVIIGPDGDAVRRSLQDSRVRVICHDGWQEGMGSSIAAAVRQLDHDLDGVVILQGDQPFVTPALLDRLIECRDEARIEMAACSYRDTLGPPAFFPRNTFERLASLSGDRGAKSILLEDPARTAVVDFPRGAFDIDTPEDYDRALAEFARLQASTPTRLKRAAMTLDESEVVQPDGLTVRRMRHDRGWSAREMVNAIATACERATGNRQTITPNLLKGIEEHNETIPYETLCLIADGFGCDPVEILAANLSPIEERYLN